MTIAIDAMGGDHGVEVTVPAALSALALNNRLHLILVGDKRLIEAVLSLHHKSVHERLRIQHATEQVAMGESPSVALRTKKDSSMRVAINLVKEGLADACVSAGNTGALMAIARFVLKMIPGVDRPAIVTSFPTRAGGEVRMLDLGANVDSCADNLYQFAVMASLLVTAVDKIDRPRIGLLNIGQEEIKGNDQVKRAAQLLTENKTINYYGYVEGDEIFTGKVDVVVCDGFVGNVALKTLEGATKLIGLMAKEEFSRSWWTKLLGITSYPIIQRLKKRLDPERYNGASFIGLQGIVIKSHGGASIKAFTCAIEEAVREVENNVLAKIGREVGALLEDSAE